MRNTSRDNPYLIESAANALRCVGMLRARGSLTVTEVSIELGVSKATAHRLLSTLLSEDYALRDPVHRRYHPGGAMFEAGLSAPVNARVRQTLRRPLEDLSARTGETIKLIVLEAAHGRVLEAVESTHTLRVGAAVGELQPANVTAAGKVLLCRHTEEELRERFGGRLPARTTNTIVDWIDFALEMQKVRARGYALNLQESTSGVSGLAVPIKGERGEILAALALVAPAERLSQASHKHPLGLLLHTAAVFDIAALRARRQVMSASES